MDADTLRWVTTTIGREIGVAAIGAFGAVFNPTTQNWLMQNARTPLTLLLAIDFAHSLLSHLISYNKSLISIVILTLACGTVCAELNFGRANALRCRIRVSITTFERIQFSITFALCRFIAYRIIVLRQPIMSGRRTWNIPIIIIVWNVDALNIRKHCDASTVVIGRH